MQCMQAGSFVSFSGSDEMFATMNARRNAWYFTGNVVTFWKKDGMMRNSLESIIKRDSCTTKATLPGSVEVA